MPSSAIKVVGNAISFDWHYIHTSRVLWTLNALKMALPLVRAAMRALESEFDFET
jgi:hypothetical protein